MARYGQAFKDRAVARLLPPQSAALDDVSREVGIGVDTLARWRSEAMSKPGGDRVWTAAARFDAVLTTAAMDEASKSAWCRAHGTYAQQLATWQLNATQALAEPGEARASPLQTKQDRRRIKELERELLRKDRALAETAALLVLKKSQGDLQHGRGRMIGLEDRQALALGIHIAHATGARLHLACQIVGIDLRTL